MEILLLLFLFLGYSIAREYLYWKQINKLQELIKAKDLQEYLRGNKSNTVHDTNKGQNGIAKEEPNTIELDETRPFDLPEDMRVQWEDESKVQRVQIYK